RRPDRRGDRAGAPAARPVAQVAERGAAAVSVLRSPALWATLRGAVAPRASGRVTRLVGLRLEVEGVDAAVNEAVHIRRSDGSVLPAEVVAVQDGTLACMPLGAPTGVRYGDRVEALG